jgi:hypothetical protein
MSQATSPTVRPDAGSSCSPIETLHSDKKKSHCGFNAGVSIHLSGWPLIFVTDLTSLNQRVPGSSPGAPTKLFKHLQYYVSEQIFHLGVFSSSSVRPLKRWRDGCALPQRLARLPAAWSALSRRSLGDRERLLRLMGRVVHSNFLGGEKPVSAP